MRHHKRNLCFVVAAIVCLLAWTPALAQLSSSDINNLRIEIAARGYHFTVSENPATQVPIDELCGLRVPPDWQKKAHYETTGLLAQPLVSLPSRFDWRDYNDVTPVRNQLSCGACWAFATAGPVEADIMRATGIAVDLSEQWLICCNTRGDNCNGGWWSFDDYVSPGAVLESAFPYAGQNLACGGPYTYPYHLATWTYVGNGSSIPSVQSIKQAIYNHGPVAAALYVGSLFQAYHGGVFDTSESGALNHGVTIVGWDDSQGSQGVWFIKNSWGPYWGESGYIRMGYGDSQIGYAAAYPTLAAIPNGSITGTIRNTGEQAVAGATVSTDTGGYTTTSAADGSYTLANVAMHTYTVTASKIGYDTQLAPSVQVVSSTATPLQFSLSPIPTSAMAQTRSAADNTVIRITGVISAEYGDCFYIADSLTRSGIRVLTTTTKAEGSSVTVSGKLTTVNGERCIGTPSVE